MKQQSPRQRTKTARRDRDSVWPRSRKSSKAPGIVEAGGCAPLSDGFQTFVRNSVRQKRLRWPRWVQN